MGMAGSLDCKIAVETLELSTESESENMLIVIDSSTHIVPIVNPS
jgi:hypothetical protein